MISLPELGEGATIATKRTTEYNGASCHTHVASVYVINLTGRCAKSSATLQVEVKVGYREISMTLS